MIRALALAVVVLGGSLVVVDPGVTGTATWLCNTDARYPLSPCSRGSSPTSMTAAIDRKDTPYDKGDRVRVTSGSRSVDVLITDTCGCPGRKVIDLTIGAFRQLADPGRGVVPVTLRLLPPVTLPETDTKPAPRAHRIARLIRAERGDRLRIDRELYRVARRRAVAMARADAHDDHRGAHRIRADRWRLSGEVIGWNSRAGMTPRWLVDAWLASPTHRAVILGRWSAMGVSCATGKRVWCVAVFGRAR